MWIRAVYHKIWCWCDRKLFTVTVTNSNTLNLMIWIFISESIQILQNRDQIDIHIHWRFTLISVINRQQSDLSWFKNSMWLILKMFSLWQEIMQKLIMNTTSSLQLIMLILRKEGLPEWIEKHPVTLDKESLNHVMSDSCSILVVDCLDLCKALLK